MRALALSALAAVLAAGSAAADPSVDLIWTATTGSGATGGSSINAVSGDTLTLDVVVNDNATGLTGAFLTLAYDSTKLLGTTAVNCPSPPNIVAGTCSTPDLDLLSPFISGVTISNTGSTSTMSLYNAAQIAGTVSTSFALTVGRATFVMAGGNSSVSLLYQPGLELITDNAFTGFSPPASAVVGDVGIDSDGDGLSDGDELILYGTDPLDPDSDGDGLDDGVEVSSTGTNPLAEDTDGDLVCDGAVQVGTCTAVGPDNCPFIMNFDQTNSDAFSAGDACQCGDLNLDNVLDGADALLARQLVVGATISVTCDLTRCNVIGPADASVVPNCNDSLAPFDCTIADVYVLERVAAALPVTLENSCQAYTGP